MNMLLKWDAELFLWLNGLGNHSWDPIWLSISEVFIWVPFYALLVFILYRALSLRNFGIALLLIAINTVFTDQGSVALFKEQFQRLRPCHVEELMNKMRLVKDGCGGLYGFVSTHATNTFGLAVLLGHILKTKHKYALPILLVWAALVSYSRIYIGVHYPLDILGGAILGSIIGIIVYQVYKKLRK